MPEKALIPQAAVGAAAGADKHSIKEAVCVHTQKIYDACREQQVTRCNTYITAGIIPGCFFIYRKSRPPAHDVKLRQ
ncbi:MAG: hypothetical protein FWG72_06180 [Oscillospiraceae bacterium]|nr:hypothetical protein [Oscillospiraceae bacterium]